MDSGSLVATTHGVSGVMAKVAGGSARPTGPTSVTAITVSKPVGNFGFMEIFLVFRLQASRLPNPLRYSVRLTQRLRLRRPRLPCLHGSLEILAGVAGNAVAHDSHRTVVTDVP